MCAKAYCKVEIKTRITHVQRYQLISRHQLMCTKSGTIFDYTLYKTSTYSAKWKMRTLSFWLLYFLSHNKLTNVQQKVTFQACVNIDITLLLLKLKFSEHGKRLFYCTVLVVVHSLLKLVILNHEHTLFFLLKIW